MRKRLRFVGVPVAAAVVAAAALPLLTSPGAQAARFTGGNLVVYRVGDGAALTNAAAPVFLDEFTPEGAPAGNSIALPIAAADGNLPLTAVGQSRSEGLISNSADGRFIALTGYGAAPGATGPGGITLTASSPTSVPRVIGLVDGNGTVDTTTKLATAAAPSIIRSAATSNGSRIYATGGNGGIVTTTLGSATATRIAGTAASNFNALTFQGTQLFTSGILANRLAKVGTGAPATTATLANVAGLPDNLLTYGYAIVDVVPAVGYAGTALDTLYIANGSNRGGTVDKYRFNGTAWTQSGYIDVAGAFGLVADVDGSDVSLAVTTPTQLLSITDEGATAATFTPDDPAVLETAAANTEFRGVALAPSAVTGPSLFVRAPAASAAVAAGTAIKVSAYVDSPDGVSSVKVKLGTTTVNATKGAGKVWTASVPTAGRAVGAATLTVSATDSAGSPATANVSRSVSIVAPKGNLAKGSFALNNKLVASKGKWTAYKSAASPTKKGQKSAVKNAKKSAKAYTSQLSLTFTRGASAGKVIVKVDGKNYVYDLYAKKTANLTKIWKFKGALKSHSISVTVAGKKNVKSKGTTVSLAVLKVK